MLQMVQTTPTDYWNDSCAVDELAYAIERGATGATSNPNIVFEVLKKERSYWLPRIREIAEANPTWNEIDQAWALIEEMAVRGAGVLAPVFEREQGRKGRLSLQTNPTNYANSDRMVSQAEHFSGLAPNMQVKFPATLAGIAGMEEATARGVNVNATVCFTVPQAIAVAEAIERGLDRFARDGGDLATMTPVCTIMVGRLDDWMKVLVDRDDLTVDPTVLDWAGIAAFKRAYEIFNERGYSARLLAAAYRHLLHWTELVGGDVILTLTHQWQVRFNNSGIDPLPRIELPVDGAIVKELLKHIPDFRRAYEPDGMTIAQFDGYGATVRTLRNFIKAYHDLIGAVRDVVLPDPDVRA
jgi:transaldolase